MAEEKALYIKFKSEPSMLHALTFNSEDLIFRYANGKTAKVHMSHAQECVFYVRIYDLPPEIPDQELTSVLTKYGNVKCVVREKFPVELGFDAYTGVRGVFMDVQKEIPTSLHFLNRKGNIFYPGNKDKCFLCKEEGHRINTCPKRKGRKQTEQSGSSTYAGAVIEGPSAAVSVAVAVSATADVQSDNTAVVQSEAAQVEEKMQEAETASAVAEISEDETCEGNNHQNHPIYQLASELVVEINKRKEEANKRRSKDSNRKAEEETKIKSPPRKKKNFSLYQK